MMSAIAIAAVLLPVHVLLLVRILVLVSMYRDEYYSDEACSD